MKEQMSDGIDDFENLYLKYENLISSFQIENVTKLKVLLDENPGLAEHILKRKYGSSDTSNKPSLTNELYSTYADLYCLQQYITPYGVNAIMRLARWQILKQMWEENPEYFEAVKQHEDQLEINGVEAELKNSGNTFQDLLDDNLKDPSNVRVIEEDGVICWYDYNGIIKYIVVGEYNKMLFDRLKYLVEMQVGYRINMGYESFNNGKLYIKFQKVSSE